MRIRIPYRTIETLQEYILIAQDQYHGECYSRQANGLWLLQEAFGFEATIGIRSIECTLALNEVYEKVELAPEGPEIARESAEE